VHQLLGKRDLALDGDQVAMDVDLLAARTVAARLGDDPKTVLGVYSHLLPQSDEIAAERVAAALVT
jgi:hypothetical protein